MSSTSVVRCATPEDATEIARLSAQLGYPAEVGVFAARLQRLSAMDTHAILVATLDVPRLAGFIALEQRLTLELGDRVEIVGLVVDDDARRGGVGRRLVAASERWARERGVHEIFLRSNVLRAEAHPFYEALGYARIKTQHAYLKQLL